MSSRSSHLTLAALSLAAVALVGADELPADAASRPPASPPHVAGIVIPEFPVEPEADSPAGLCRCMAESCYLWNA